MSIITGDSAEELKNFPDNYFDSCVVDPPYGIEFLNKNWDNNTGAVEIWREVYRTLKPGAYLLAFSAPRTYHKLASNLEEIGFDIKDQLMWLYASGFPKAQDVGKNIAKNFEHNDDWSGWKTALKPAHEPIVMARKPTKLSTAKNIQEWGTGALNIDGCRIPYEIKPSAGHRTSSFHNATGGGETNSGGDGSGGWEANTRGRYPSNVIGEVEGYQKYFYCPKVSKNERHIGYTMSEGEMGNNHPTVKPRELVGYLIRLVTPKGGRVLDPFCGSGSTGLGCIDEGVEFTGIELDPDYAKIAETRIRAYDIGVNSTTYKDLFK